MPIFTHLRFSQTWCVWVSSWLVNPWRCISRSNNGWLRVVTWLIWKRNLKFSRDCKRVVYCRNNRLSLSTGSVWTGHHSLWPFFLVIFLKPGFACTTLLLRCPRGLLSLSVIVLNVEAKDPRLPVSVVIHLFSHFETKPVMGLGIFAATGSNGLCSEMLSSAPALLSRKHLGPWSW